MRSRGVVTFLSYGREALKDADDRVKKCQADVRRGVPIIVDESKVDVGEIERLPTPGSLLLAPRRPPLSDNEAQEP